MLVEHRPWWGRELSRTGLAWSSDVDEPALSEADPALYVVETMTGTHPGVTPSGNAAAAQTLIPIEPSRRRSTARARPVSGDRAVCGSMRIVALSVPCSRSLQKSAAALKKRPGLASGRSTMATTWQNASSVIADASDDASNPSRIVGGKYPSVLSPSTRTRGAPTRARSYRASDPG